MGRKKKKHPDKSSKKDLARKTHPSDSDRLLKKVLKPEVLLIGVFILALFIRLIYINQIQSTPIFQGLAVDDEKYESFALQILKGNLTHKDFIYLNPFYPFFLSLIYLIFGQSHLSVVIIQAVLDSISCVVIYYIASLLFNKKAGIISALIYACYGIAIFYTGILLAPTVVIFLSLLFIASLLAAQEKSKRLLFFISGILFGLVVLARPNVVLFIFFLPLWFFTTLKNSLGIRHAIQGFLLFLVGFFLVISLISVRNYSLEKNFSPFSVQGGINFYIGNNPETKGYFMSLRGISTSPIDQVKTSIRNAEKQSGKRLTPTQASRYWLLKGLEFIKDNPLDALLLTVKKFALFWRKEEIPLNINYPLCKTIVPIFQLPFISFGIIASFALIGILLSLKEKRNTLLTALFIFSYMLSVILFFVAARYRVPIAPFLIIYSSYICYRFAEMIRAKEVRGIAIVVALFILLFSGINMNFEYFKFVSISKEDYNNLGNVYRSKGRLDEAIAEFKKALSIDPYFVEAHCNLGTAYLKKGLIKKAIDKYKNALKIDQDFALAHYNLGIAYDRIGKLGESIPEYKKALDIDPYYAEAHTNLGFVYFKKGRLDEAIEESKKAITINPNLIEAHTLLGRVYDKKGMADEAIKGYKKSLKIDPNYAIAHNNLSVSYYYKGNYKLAILHSDKAVERGYRVHPNFLKLLKPYR